MDLICNWVHLRFCIDEVYQHLIFYRFMLTIYLDPFNVQWRSQNTKKIMHIKGRLLDQALILFNRVPFQNGNLLMLRIGSQRERILSFMSSFL